jgi:hypothetical protein
MKYKSIIYLLLLNLFLCKQIELSLYKSSRAYESLKSSNATIEDIENAQFLTELNLGSPSQSIPLQVEMTTEETSILNNKISKQKVPILSTKTSNTFQIVEEKQSGKQLAVDRISVNDINFDLQFQSANKVISENNNMGYSGILGLSLGDIKSKKENKFVEQLEKNKLTSNSAFYFEFQELDKSRCQVPTLEDYLGIK